MKKCFLVLVTLAVLSFGSVAFAQDVWVYGNSSSNVYVMTETYDRKPSPADFSIKAKVVRSNNTYSIHDYYFYRSGAGKFNHTWHCKIDNNKELEILNGQHPDLDSIFRFCVQRFQS